MFLHARNWPMFVLAALLIPLALGCGGNSTNNNVLAPQFQPEVVNLTDDFQFQTTGVSDITQTLAYTWRNTGAQANVDQSCSISSGSGMLSLRDSTGTLLYSGDLSNGGSVASAVGAAGAWTVYVDLIGATGTFNFRLQKKT